MMLTFGSSSYSARLDMLRKLVEIKAQPFCNQVAQSPWDDLVDVPDMHTEVKERLRFMIEHCERPSAIRIQTVISPAGYGKTHLLGWLRQHQENAGRGVFIYVAPHRFESPESASFEQHILQATYQSLWRQNDLHRDNLIRSIHNSLVESYDEMVSNTNSTKESLGLAPGFFTGLLGYNLKIAGKSPEKQLKALQDALACAPFLDAAFAAFKKRHPVDSAGVQYDRDAFICVLLLACGNAKQVDVAERWLSSKATDAEMKLCHIDRLCRSTSKVRDALFTLRRMANQPFCVAFDQLEDTYRSLPSSEQGSRIFGNALSGIIRDLGLIQGFSIVFMFNSVLWQEFCRSADTWLVDRLTEGKGVCQLQPLNDSTAQELIRVRMQRSVWDRLDAFSAPDDEPTFPFTPALIKEIRTQAQGELRTFLFRAQTLYEKLLNPQAPIELIAVEPDTVWCDRATAVAIHCKNLPSLVRTFLGDHELPAKLNAAEGFVEVVVSGCSPGQSALCIQSAEQPLNQVRVPFQVKAIPQPLCQWIDAQKVQNRRIEKAITLKSVRERLDLTAHWLSKLINGTWEAAADDLYYQLAQCLEVPLSELLKSTHEPSPGDIIEVELEPEEAM